MTKTFVVIFGVLLAVFVRGWLDWIPRWFSSPWHIISFVLSAVVVGGLAILFLVLKMEINQ